MQSLSGYGHMVAAEGVAPTLAHLSGEYSAVKLCGSDTSLIPVLF